MQIPCIQYASEITYVNKIEIAPNLFHFWKYCSVTPSTMIE